jgi:hypothetical protein
MKITWKNIKEYVYIATIVIGVMFHFVDKAKSTTTYQVTFVIHQQDYEKFKLETKEKLKDYDKRWDEDIKGDERVFTMLELLTDEWPRP